MKLAHLTAGAGNFHCGTCLRDHALVVALKKLGHDPLMVPLYLPFVLDKPDEHGSGEIFLGGVNVYLQDRAGLFRHTPRWMDRLLDGRWLLRKAADRAGMTHPRDLGRLTLAMLQGEAGTQRKELDRLVQHLSVEHRPQVIVLSNALLIGAARTLKQRIGCPIVCTLQGEDTFLDSLIQPYREQCWAELNARADDVDLFVAVSDYHRGIMGTRMKLDAARLRVVHNGIDFAGYHPADAPPTRPTIGYLARLCPSKGLHTLVDAFIVMKQRNDVPGLAMAIAGAATPADMPYVQQMTERLRAAGVMNDVSIETNVSLERKQQMLRSLSVLSVPATYGESFGLYVIEALASGVPFVQPVHAAFPELLAATGGGILCRPDDIDDLAAGLRRLLLNDSERRALGDAGRKAVLERFSVERMARQFADLLEEVRHGV